MSTTYLSAFDNIEVEKTRSAIGTDMASTQVHPFYEMYFLLWGERRYFIGNRIYNVSPGNLVVIPKNEIHKTISINKKGYDRYVIYFTDKSVANLIELIGREAFAKFEAMGCIQFPPEHAVSIKRKVEELAGEFPDNDPFSSAMRQCLLTEIILAALRFGTAKNCAIDDGADKIQTAAKYISENYQSDITLDSVAKMACMERTYFSKKFKALTGLGFNSYLTHTRINAAKALLHSSKMSIGEISDSCGFSGANYFGDLFTRQVGISPSKYRKRTCIDNKE